jgi:hypothetical protein
VLMTVAYSFLLRVQSEMLGLEAGSEAELSSGMPPSRHSAACVKDGQLHIRLKVRKHRPRGSLLIRSCICHEVFDNRLCPVHCISWEDMGAGEKVVGISATAAQQRLRRYAKLCTVPGAAQTTLKVFRASRATNLALAGKPLHMIMQAGEWRSSAVLHYCSEEALDVGQMVQNTITEDAEDSAEEAE